VAPPADGPVFAFLLERLREGAVVSMSRFQVNATLRKAVSEADVALRAELQAEIGALRLEIEAQGRDEPMASEARKVAALEKPRSRLADWQ
jgi:hypothetical protein